MVLRKYQASDLQKIAKLFYETVHTVNAKDYNNAQLDVWAVKDMNLDGWKKSFLEHDTIVAVERGILVGFGDMTNDGYLDRLYVHKDFQRQGVATAIVSRLENKALNNGIFTFSTHASITALPFFVKQGYISLKENIVIKGGVQLKNFIMEKTVKV